MIKILRGLYTPNLLTLWQLYLGYQHFCATYGIKINKWSLISRKECRNLKISCAEKGRSHCDVNFHF
jgi:hypothetical protein